MGFEDDDVCHNSKWLNIKDNQNSSQSVSAVGSSTSPLRIRRKKLITLEICRGNNGKAHAFSAVLSRTLFWGLQKFSVERQTASAMSMVSSPVTSFPGHSWTARNKAIASTFTQQFRALTNETDFASAGNIDSRSSSNSKVKWRWTILAFHQAGEGTDCRRLSRQAPENDVAKNGGGFWRLVWTRTREREVHLVVAKLTHYPAHCNPLPNERPQGGAGKGIA